MKTLSRKARLRLLNTLIDSALDGMPDKDIDAIAEAIIVRGATLVADRFEFDPQQAILIRPMNATARILRAINEHMEATDEDCDTIAARVIACLGSQAAAASQPN